MSATAIAVRGVHVRVRRHFWTAPRALLTDLSFTVAPGETFALLGPNGAGKTTTYKVMLGLLRPDAGSVEIFGKRAGDPAGRRRLGFMPERAYFPEHLTGLELCIQHGRLAGLSGSAARRDAAAVLERVGLGAAAGARLATYSKGMLQRAGLAQAMMGDPELLLLDEPMSGLDPLGRREVRDLIAELGRAGKTVVLASHILPDVEALCSRAAILVGGTLRKVGTLAELVGDEGVRAVEVVADGVDDATLRDLAALGTAERQGDAVRFIAADWDRANRAIDRLRQSGARVLGVNGQGRSLEDVFVGATASHPEARR